MLCPRCGVDTTMAAPVDLVAETLQVGFVGRGVSSSAALRIRTPARDAVYTADGRLLDPAVETPHGFVAVDGVSTVRCEIAASLLLCASGALDGLGGDRLEAVLIADRTASTASAASAATDHVTDVPRARRAAAELACAGSAPTIAMLPLSRGEIDWWSAMAHLRTGDRDAAIRHLADLPLNGYAITVVVLRWAASRWVGDASSNARFLLEQRLSGTPTQRLGRVTVACGSTLVERFLLDPSAPMPDALRTVSPTSAAVDRALALAGARLDGLLSVGPAVSASVLDDLIDLGVALEPASLSDDQRRQLLARTRPETLSDPDVELLGLHHERDRRRLAAGRIDDIDSSAADPHVRGIVHLANEGTVSDELRAVTPGVGDELVAFLASPSPITLTDGLVADPSLWPLLARRLTVPLWNWKADHSPAAQRFVGWLALRATFEHLSANDWRRAVESGTHAARLGADDLQRCEALDMIAFAHWQLDDAAAACEVLLTAVEHHDDPVLRVNLAIVTASTDPDQAAVDLATMVGNGGPHLRRAAALCAVRMWTTDDLPWTVRRRRPLPPLLQQALRELAAEPVEPVEPVEPGVLRAVLAMQSNVDREWLARPGRLSASPHRTSLEAKVYQARATGPREFVDALISALRVPAPPAWVVDERNRAIDIAVRSVFDDDGSSALFALFAIERKLPMEQHHRSMLAPLAALAMCEQYDPGMEPPAAMFRQLLLDADEEWRRSRPSAHMRHLMEAAWERLAEASVHHLELAVQRMVRDVDDVADHLRRDVKYRRNTHAVLAVIEPIVDDAVAADDVLSTFRPRVAGRALLSDIDDLLLALRDVRRAAMRLM